MSRSETGAMHARRPSTAGTLFYVLLGPIVWAAHLAVIYGAQSSLCGLGVPAAGADGLGIVTAVTTLATAVALALLAAALLVPGAASRWLRAAGWPAPVQLFCDRAMALLAALSAFGVAWAGVTVFLIPACLPLR